MKKKLIVFILLLNFPVFSGALDCINKLTAGGYEDSMYFSLNIDELDDIYVRDFNGDIMAQGYWMVRALLNEKGCKALPSNPPDYISDVNFKYLPHGIAKSRCHYSYPSLESGLTCNIESNLGKFLIYWDDFVFVHIIYSRWD